MIVNTDCMEFMRTLPDKFVDFSITDIPYEAVNRDSNGLRDLDKGDADEGTFNLIEFLEELYRVTKNSVCVFCGKEQFSRIYKFFADKQGTTRPIVWEKTNPSPMNGQYIYLSGIELAVWHKKRGGKTFNAYCKNTVFRFPSGKRSFHPTQKNLELFKELIRDNTNEKDLVFDPCAGSCTTAIACIETNREWICCEISEDYAIKSQGRIDMKLNSFDTTEKELQVTKDFLSLFGITAEEIKKEQHWDSSDTVATINGKQIAFEVKEDCLWRWKRWHQYGVDMFSAFTLKNPYDTKTHSPNDIANFTHHIDAEKEMKFGKCIYSNADIWIFYTKDKDGYVNLKGYDYTKMNSDMARISAVKEYGFFFWLTDNCNFAINSKRKDDVSGDTYESSVFFLNPNDIEQWLITENYFKERLS